MIQDVSVEKHFASGRLTTAEDIHRAVFEELDLPEDYKEVFSVWLSSKHLRKCARGSDSDGGSEGERRS